MGLNLEARHAGYNPKTKPIPTDIEKARITISAVTTVAVDIRLPTK